MFLNHYIRWRGNCLYRDQSPHFKLSDTEPEQLLPALYQRLPMNYPKFFKMDMLCRTALLATEILQPNYDAIDKQKVALVITTHTGCIDVDQKFEESRKTFASPALFVYTLPNIMLGEISIRQGIKGEQICSIAPEFDPEWFDFYVNELIHHHTEACIFGHIDATSGWIAADLFWATMRPQEGLEIELTHENIAQLTPKHLS